MKVNELQQTIKMIAQTHKDHHIFFAHDNKILTPENVVMLPHPDDETKTAFVVIQLQELNNVIEQTKEG